MELQRETEPCFMTCDRCCPAIAERKSDVSAATPSTFFFAETDETRGVLGATVVINPSKEHHSRSVFHTYRRISLSPCTRERADEQEFETQNATKSHAACSPCSGGTRLSKIIVVFLVSEQKSKKT